MFAFSKLNRNSHKDCHFQDFFLILNRTITILGLLCVALAAGAIKPCITAFGGDQFKLPDQEKELNSFFPFLYIWINLSLLVAGLVTPILRRDVSCFGKESCYSLAFAVPFTFIVLSVRK